MPNNHRPDPFRDLFDDQELSSLFDEDEEDEELAGREFDEDEDLQCCPGCAGKGRYVGLFKIEDPCERCGGSGTVRASSSSDEHKPAS